MGYKRIYRYLRLFLIIYPLLYRIFIAGAVCDRSEGICNNFMPMSGKVFLVTYILGFIIICGIAGIYTIFLIRNKILYKIQQCTKRFRKFFKIQKKKIGKYPIIIQYTYPKGLTPMEVGYLYNLKQFKGSISCLIYKWAFEKRISLSFKKGNYLSFDKVVIKIIDNSLKKMPEDEQFQWNLIFGEDKEITLPNVNVLKNIPLINLKTAKICLNKNLIEKKRSITLKSKYIEWIFVIVSILRFLSVFLMNRLQEQMQGKLSDWILIGGVCWIIVILFFLVLLDATFKDTELTYYNLSENGKEFLAKIYGYKYFLEACDEKKIKTFLDQDPEYLDKIMPYAIALGVETEIIENIAPNILDGINNNRYTGDLSCTTKTVITSSERTILFPTEKNEIHKGNKSTKTTKETKIKR